MKTHFLIVSISLLFSLATDSQAAEWQECRRAKLESLQLQNALRSGGVVRGYRDRSAMRSAMRRKDKWLWRECRRYSGELRDVAIK